MNVRLLAPIRGWRIFIGEVGVIVLGVLLALGAQQLVENIRIRGDVATFRKTIDEEIALNLYRYDVRSQQAACVDKQMDQLKDWLDQARDGTAVPALGSAGPFNLSPYRSAWDNRNAVVFAHVPDKARAKYSEFYDELDNNSSQSNLERETWQMLDPYAEPGPIGLQDRRMIRSTLQRARWLNQTISENFDVSRSIAKELAIRAAAPDGVPALIAPALAECPSPIAGK